jgi:hypothetical protein
VIRRLLGLASKPRPYFAACEYWIYLPEEKLVPQEVLSGRLLRSSPFASEGKAPIGPSEALLFSDIRLHIALVLKSKNPHHFRPDLFEEHIAPTPETLEGLSEATAFAKARFVSDEPLSDARHVKLMPHLAEAIAYYGQSKVLFDAVSEELLTAEQLRERLRQEPEASGPDLHLRTVWIRSERGGRGATRGLLKVGLPELETPESPAEHETVIRTVLEQAAEKLWNAQELQTEIEVPLFGDTFQVTIDPKGKSPLCARILRVPPA